VAAHRVAADHEAAFREWVYSVTAAAVTFDGFQGSRIFPPTEDSPKFTIQFQFDSMDGLHAFWTSGVYAEWRARLRPLLAAPSEYRYVSGLEHWAPRAHDLPRPPTYKMAIAVYGALLPLVALVGPVLERAFAALPRWLELPLTTAVVVLVMSYAAMPAATRLLSPWLFPRRG